MIDFRLFKKDDFIVLIDGFDTNFLQMPMKRPAKSLQKYIPNGFRPEKLNRNQLNKVYIEALSEGEATLSSFMRAEIQRNFDNIGLTTYFKYKEFNKQQIARYIIEISNIIFENDLVIPAQLVLKLYGIECNEEEDKLAQRLHNVFHSKREGARGAGIEYGIKYSQEKALSDLEAERKKCSKLQKNFDAVVQKHSDASEKIKQLQEENKILTQKLKSTEKLISELEKSKNDADKYVLQLNKENDEYKVKIIELTTELEKLKSTNMTLQESLAAAQIAATATENILSGDTLKEVCQSAIRLLDSDSKSRKEALYKAKQIFINEEDVKDAWSVLCEKSSSFIEEICDLLIDGNIGDEDINKFAELDGLLLIESVIKTALLSVTYKTLSNSAISGASCYETGYEIHSEEIE